MKPHQSPRINKNQFVAIRAIRGLCGIGVLVKIDYTTFANFSMEYHLMCKVYTDVGGIK